MANHGWNRTYVCAHDHGRFYFVSPVEGGRPHSCGCPAPAPAAELRRFQGDAGRGNLKENENCVSVARVWEEGSLKSNLLQSSNNSNKWWLTMQKLQPSAGRDKKNKQKKGPELKTRLWLERATSEFWLGLLESSRSGGKSHGGLFSDCQRGDRWDQAASGRDAAAPI